MSRFCCTSPTPDLCYFPSQSCSIPSNHSSFLGGQTYQAWFHLGAFAPAVPSAGITLLFPWMSTFVCLFLFFTSGLSSKVTSLPRMNVSSTRALASVSLLCPLSLTCLLRECKPGANTQGMCVPVTFWCAVHPFINLLLRRTVLPF